MEQQVAYTPDAIRSQVFENPKARPRDLADKLGIAEGALVAAHIGHGSVAVEAHPDKLMPAICALGEVMALTRNISAVHEKIGTYANYHAGDHAAMVLADAIDLRIFPKHWQHAYAVNKLGPDGQTRHSLQIFDAAGDAVHKVILRDTSDLDAWHKLVAELAVPHASSTPGLSPRSAVEAPKADESKTDILRREWAKLSDTHQFMRLTAKLKMNRLGAYRIVGAPFAQALVPTALNDALEALSESGTPVMIFVGNRGCIQIHSGPIDRLMPMGPWQNVMDPDFNLHLRADHIAELWLVEKPAKRGPATSLEAFDAEGRLILQCFGLRKESGPDHSTAFAAMAKTLSTNNNLEATRQ
ncbi:MAG: ChuX/HutX family heme-like substrate-binding protein [Pseudomonadota bacterium]